MNNNNKWTNEQGYRIINHKETTGNSTGPNITKYQAIFNVELFLAEQC